MIDATTNDAIQHAVEYLSKITAEAGNALIEKILLTHTFANRNNLEIQFYGEHSQFNPLLSLMGTNFNSAQKVFDLVDKKREETNLPALTINIPEDSGYLREFLENKRGRLQRMIEITNANRSISEKLRGTARLNFERETAEVWHTQHLERAKELQIQLGRRLTQEEKRAVSEDCWKDIDRTFDRANPAHVRTEEAS